jgi:hypothetical protein
MTAVTITQGTRARTIIMEPEEIIIQEKPIRILSRA